TRGVGGIKTCGQLAFRGRRLFTGLTMVTTAGASLSVLSHLFVSRLHPSDLRNLLCCADASPRRVWIVFVNFQKSLSHSRTIASVSHGSELRRLWYREIVPTGHSTRFSCLTTNRSRFTIWPDSSVQQGNVREGVVDARRHPEN